MFEDEGRPRERVLAELEEMRQGDADWRGGRVPLYVFSGPPEVHEIGLAAFTAYFTENALGARRAFPSLARMEAEIIGMGLDLFHGGADAAGSMTSGGTESIILAVKASRDHSRRARRDPAFRGNIVIPQSCHPAFDKAAAMMDLEIRRVPTRPDFRADVPAMAEAADADTILLVGSAPCFPFGVVDPLAELSALAVERDIWLHTDACVGGWMLQFVGGLGYSVPRFDFVLPGVRSLSADLHKFGFCPKPASAVFFRSAELREHSSFDFDVWPSGRFTTTTLVGTRPGGAVAAAWAVLRYLGRNGYTGIARRIMTMRDAYLEGLAAIPGMCIRGTPDFANIAFGVDDINMAEVAALLGARGWVPGMVRTPASLHLVLSFHHEPVRETYVRDVAECVSEVRASRKSNARLEASYA